MLLNYIHGVDDWQSPAFDHDPGNLADQIDPVAVPLMRHEHTALNGAPHVTPEQLERIAADTLPPALWRGV